MENKIDTPFHIANTNSETPFQLFCNKISWPSSIFFFNIPSACYITYICVSSETANFNLKVVLNPTAPKMGGRADLLLEMKQILRFLQKRGEGERARVQRMVVIFLTSLCILDSWLGELSSNLEDIFLIWQNTNQEDHLLDLTITLFLKRGQICCILLCTYCVIWSQKVLYCVKQ